MWSANVSPSDYKKAPMEFQKMYECMDNGDHEGVLRNVADAALKVELSKEKPDQKRIREIRQVKSAASEIGTMCNNLIKGDDVGAIHSAINATIKGVSSVNPTKEEKKQLRQLKTFTPIILSAIEDTFDENISGSSTPTSSGSSTPTLSSPIKEKKQPKKFNSLTAEILSELKGTFDENLSGSSEPTLSSPTKSNKNERSKDFTKTTYSIDTSSKENKEPNSSKTSICDKVSDWFRNSVASLITSYGKRNKTYTYSDSFNDSTYWKRKTSSTSTAPKKQNTYIPTSTKPTSYSSTTSCKTKKSEHFRNPTYYSNRSSNLISSSQNKKPAQSTSTWYNDINSLNKKTVSTTNIRPKKQKTYISTSTKPSSTISISNPKSRKDDPIKLIKYRDYTSSSLTTPADNTKVFSDSTPIKPQKIISKPENYSIKENSNVRNQVKTNVDTRDVNKPISLQKVGRIALQVLGWICGVIGVASLVAGIVLSVMFGPLGALAFIGVAVGSGGFFGIGYAVSQLHD